MRVGGLSGTTSFVARWLRPVTPSLGGAATSRTPPSAPAVCRQFTTRPRASAFAWCPRCPISITWGSAAPAVTVSMPPIGKRWPWMAWTTCKVVLDVMDAWPENFARLIPGPDWLRDILWRILCARAIRRARRAYRGADAVSAVGVTYLGLAMRYGCRAPRHLCYHGIMRMNNGATRYSLDENRRPRRPRPLCPWREHPPGPRRHRSPRSPPPPRGRRLPRHPLSRLPLQRGHAATPRRLRPRRHPHVPR